MGIKVEQEIKYLGIQITNKRNSFTTYKKQCIEKAQKLANAIYSITYKSCSRLLIGKTCWKRLALPSFIHGTEALAFTKEKINKLQIIENQVYRGILKLPSDTAVSVRRAEIGASSCEMRDLASKILYVKHLPMEMIS